MPKNAKQDNSIKLFQDQPVRTVWNEEEEKWYFSVVDVVRILTDQPDIRRAAKYWSVLKVRIKNESDAQLTTICSQLKMLSEDGKAYKTDAADTEQLFRIIQSIPSKKAEPFKRWLAKVGTERIEETIDPEIAIDRALETYLKKGYNEEWVHQRLLAIRVRNNLTDEWRKRGVKRGAEYAILTDEITKAWSGMTTREYKNLKGLKKENLRDNMSDLELVLTMLSEATATELSQTVKPKGLVENQTVARQGGTIAGNARREIEKASGRPVVTPKNAAQLNEVVTDLIGTDLTGEENEN